MDEENLDVSLGEVMDAHQLLKRLLVESITNAHGGTRLSQTTASQVTRSIERSSAQSIAEGAFASNATASDAISSAKAVNHVTSLASSSSVELGIQETNQPDLGGGVSEKEESFVQDEAKVDLQIRVNGEGDMNVAENKEEDIPETLQNDDEEEEEEEELATAPASKRKLSDGGSAAPDSAHAHAMSDAEDLRTKRTKKRKNLVTFEDDEGHVKSSQESEQALLFGDLGTQSSEVDFVEVEKSPSTLNTQPVIQQTVTSDVSVLQTPRRKQSHSTFRSPGCKSLFSKFSKTSSQRSSGLDGLANGDESLWQSLRDEEISPSWAEAKESVNPAKSIKMQWIETLELLTADAWSNGPIARAGFEIARHRYRKLYQEEIEELSKGAGNLSNCISMHGILPAVHRAVLEQWKTSTDEWKRAIRELMQIPGMDNSTSLGLLRKYNFRMANETHKSIDNIKELSSLQRIGLHVAAFDRDNENISPMRDIDFALFDSGFEENGNKFEIKGIRVKNLWKRKYFRFLVTVHRDVNLTDALPSLITKFALKTDGEPDFMRVLQFEEQVIENNKGQGIILQRVLGVRKFHDRGKHFVMDFLLTKGTEQVQEYIKLYFSWKDGCTKEQTVMKEMQQGYNNFFPDLLNTVQAFMSNADQNS